MHRAKDDFTLFSDFLFKLSANMTTTSSDLKSLFEIKSFEGSGFHLWKERMLGIHFLKDCEWAVLEVKLDDIIDVAWMKLNKKAISYIKMAV